MNYILLIDEILALLKANGDVEILNELNEIKTTSYTSTELLMSFTYGLKQTIKNNPQLKPDFDSLLNELIGYCHKCGISIK